MGETPRISSTILSTIYGEFEFYCFTWGEHEEDNILCTLERSLSHPTLVRVQSACYTAEIFRSLDCDCHQQLDMKQNKTQMKLACSYMLCDGRGAGLYQKRYWVSNSAERRGWTLRMHTRSSDCRGPTHL